MKNIFKYMMLLTVLGTVIACDDDAPFDRANFVNLQPKSESVEVVDQETASVDVKVYSTAIVGNDRVFNINLSNSTTTLDPQAFTLPQTVTIPGGTNEGTLTVDISDVNLSGALITLTAKKIEFSISSDGETLASNDLFTINVVEQCLENEVNLSIQFDNYPEESYWAIYDAADTSTPLYTGGLNSSYADFGSTSEKFCLADGDYIFAFFDSYGDGICCASGSGSYTLSRGNEVLASGGEFDSQDVTPFSL